MRKVPIVSHSLTRGTKKSRLPPPLPRLRPSVPHGSNFAVLTFYFLLFLLVLLVGFLQFRASSLMRLLRFVLRTKRERESFCELFCTLYCLRYGVLYGRRAKDRHRQGQSTRFFFVPRSRYTVYIKTPPSLPTLLHPPP